MFLIRMAFWLSVVILLLPAGTDEQTNGSEQSPRAVASAGQTINAAVSAVGDIAGLCDRQPQVCRTGSAAWQMFQAKALYGVGLLYDWANGADEAPDAVPPETDRSAGLDARREMPIVLADNADTVHTGTAAPQHRKPSKGPRSRNTLRIDDLIPVWRGPVGHKRA